MGAQRAEGLQQGRPSGRRERSPPPLPNLGASPRRENGGGAQPSRTAPGAARSPGMLRGRGDRSGGPKDTSPLLSLPSPPHRPPGAVVPAGPRTQRAGDRLWRPGLAPRPLPAVPRTPPSLPGCHVTPPPAGTPPPRRAARRPLPAPHGLPPAAAGERDPAPGGSHGCACTSRGGEKGVPTGEAGMRRGEGGRPRWLSGGAAGRGSAPVPAYSGSGVGRRAGAPGGGGADREQPQGSAAARTASPAAAALPRPPSSPAPKASGGVGGSGKGTPGGGVGAASPRTWAPAGRSWPCRTRCLHDSARWIRGSAPAGSCCSSCGSPWRAGSWAPPPPPPRCQHSSSGRGQEEAEGRRRPRSRGMAAPPLRFPRPAASSAPAGRRRLRPRSAPGAAGPAPANSNPPTRGAAWPALGSTGEPSRVPCRGTRQQCWQIYFSFLRLAVKADTCWR